MRRLARGDLYFLLTVVLGRQDARSDWCHARCLEIMNNPDEHLDLWGRDHYKSTTISIALTVQDILKDPEVTIGVFSFSAGAAQDIVAQIKRELESRAMLRWLFPDIIWERPRKEAPSWSIQNGITVKRKSNPRECTVEGHSFMEGSPVGKHFAICLYDDTVTEDSVGSPEMIVKTTKRWELSLALGRRNAKRRYVGTRYHFQDTYRAMMDRQAVKLRLYRAVDDAGVPLYMTSPEIEAKRRAMGPTTFASQMQQDPNLDSTAGFLEEWLRYYDKMPARSKMNVYIVVDPANEKKKDSDWTTMWAIGVAGDYNYYMLDCIHDRISLNERGKKLINLWRKWSPDKKNKVNGVGYEKYGKDADIDAIENLQAEEACRFPITPLGGSLSKKDRINRLEPVYSDGRIWFPRMLFYTRYDGIMVDLVHHFIHQEYLPYPAIRYFDMLDAQARILDEDLGVVFPKPSQEDTVISEPKGTSWAR